MPAFGSGRSLPDLDNDAIDASLRQGDYPARQRDLIAQEEILNSMIAKAQ
jgi:hypothetical protein